MSDDGLLEPGTHRVAELTDDDAFLRCLVDVEIAWVRAQGNAGLVADSQVRAVSAVVEPERWARAFDVRGIAARAEGGGNPVIPMLADLRAAVREIDPDAVPAIHRGLTSQDVMDTALMLLAQHCLAVIEAGLTASSNSLAVLAQAHRSTPAVARTLTQSGLPATFGLRCARWLTGLLDALEQVRDVHPKVAIGGAVGTLAGTAALFAPAGQAATGPQSIGGPEGAVVTRVDELVQSWAGELGLEPAEHVWHTARAPMLRLASALAEVAVAAGEIGNDVLLLSRPEIAELREPVADGRGVSSAMPHKQNPVLSVLLRRTALAAPHLVAQVYSGAANFVDERPDGAWHVEWPALRSLLRLATSSVLHVQELVEGLQVFPEAMLTHLRAAAPGVVSERIVATLAPLRRADEETSVGKAAIQEAMVQAGGETERTVDLLLAVTDGASLPDGRPVTREVLEELCDPTTYTGLAAPLVDAAVLRHQNLHQQSEEPRESRPR